LLIGLEEKLEVSSEENVLELPRLEDDSSGTDTLGNGTVFQPVSDMERVLDRKTRLQVLLQLFQLACAMVSKACFVYACARPSSSMRTQYLYQLHPDSYHLYSYETAYVVNKRCS